MSAMFEEENVVLEKEIQSMEIVETKQRLDL